MKVSLEVRVDRCGEYRVEQNRHGIAVYGRIPVDDLVALVKVWDLKGYDLADAEIAAHLRAAMVVTTAESSRAWRRDLGIEVSP